MRTKLLAVLAVTSLSGCATNPPAPTPLQTATPGTAVTATPYPPPPPGTSRPDEALPNTRLDADSLTCSRPGSSELNAFYLRHRPPHALYFFKILYAQGAYFIVIIRANESERLQADHRSPELPRVEKIIGPIHWPNPKEWHVVYAYLRTYAVAPPSGNYCWEDDCFGFFNRRLDNNEGDFPPKPGENPPGWPPVTGMVVSTDKPYYPGTGAREVERGVRFALAGATNAQIDLATLEAQPAPAASTGAPCPSEVSSKLTALKAQAKKIVEVASGTPSK